jgi:hypothetical protein
LAKSLDHNIFPDLPPRAEIFEKVRLIEKAWLDDAPLGFPENLVPLLRKLHFFRVKGTRAFFKEKEGRLQPEGLSANFLSAAYNLAMPLVWVIRCRRGELNLSMGTNIDAAPGLASLLAADLGEGLVEPAPPRPELLESYRGCSALTGIPHLPKGRTNSERDTIQPPPLDHLLLGLLSEEWLFLVQSFPISREQAGRWLEQLAREIKDIKEAFLLRDIQKSNRMAAYYVEVLEKTLQRLKLGTQQGLWQTGVYFLASDVALVYRGAALLAAVFAGEKSGPEPIRTHICSKGGKTSPFINCYNSRELERLIMLPGREFPGFRLREQAMFDVDFSGATDRSLALGRIKVYDHTLDYDCSIPVDDLTKHALVAGMTGSGKTNTVFQILKELYQSHEVPFLVIESAKAEYRNLLTEIDNLLVFTLGEERPGLSAPFRLNPFAFPPGMSLQTHLDYLKAVFNAAFVMYAPMPYVLDECLYRIYEDKGWNLVTSTNQRGVGAGAFPTLTDLYHKIDEVVANLGYQDRTTMDIKAALQTRIRNLCLGGKGMMLNCNIAVPWGEIMTRPTVLELKCLGNDEEKAFLMGLILTAIWEYHESQRAGGTIGKIRLRHLTVIEEAHRLLRNVPTEKASEEQSNIKGKGIETFCNLLAEIRAYGEGILVSEQIPCKLASDVVKNSGLKIVHRLVAGEDRNLLGETMNLDTSQKRQAVCLEAGEAIFFREGMDRPVQIQIPLSTLKSDDSTVDDTALASRMAERFYTGRPEILQKFFACRICPNLHREECERVKAVVNNRRSPNNQEKTQVQLFLPYVLHPEEKDGWQHLAELVDRNLQPHLQQPGSLMYCLAAHLIDAFLLGKGNFAGWSFLFMEEVRWQAQEALTSGEFAALVGTACRTAALQDQGTTSICASHCRLQCLLGYEGGVLSRNPLLHQQLAGLLRTSEYGPRFYTDLAILLLNYLREYVPLCRQEDQTALAICILVRKMEELSFSPALQPQIVEKLCQGLSGIRNNCVD